MQEIDFDAVYQGKPPVDGSEAAFEKVPWDIGEPQPVVVALADAGDVRGDVLDVGCGQGDNSIFLATRGFHVTGVDGSTTALEIARQRAARQGARVDFVQADATTLDGIEPQFDTVLDSALYHCLEGDQRSAYSAALHRVTRPGARLHLLCFADVGNEALAIPMAVSQDDLRQHLGRHWDIHEIRAADYTTSLTQEGLAHAMQLMQQVPEVDDPSALRTDEQGRIVGQVWHLRATRIS
ncbi:class I SAM-dependent methyltransferase [Amycolatopsis suaedae]|uniref:Class I SAM-dependent methyltransferase n=1 Tax=Amycolatopsis suaedae TaxID=2510978 RepID=A0A4Q7J4C5_9PSEU|nr:class I SAM-dependent methyltransferase [Amycolatopsis suaedae]